MKITANMVTIARILLLPIPCVMLGANDTTSLWFAFVIFVVLGMTDIVDGIMARREGPTKLGGILDPVADKIFVAAIILSLVSIQKVPAWFAVLIFLREFIVTTLRSSMAVRGRSVETSMFAKLKTIVQMGGVGTIFLTFYGDLYWIKVLSISLCLILFAISLALLALYKKWPPYWVFPVSGSFLFWFSLLSLFQTETTILALMAVIIFFTWASATDYLISTYRHFMQTGLKVFDLSRLFWGFSFAICVLPFVVWHPNLIILILLSFAFEMVLGGVDNFVSTEKNMISSSHFLVSGFSSVIFAALVTAELLPLTYYPLLIGSLLLSASAVNFFIAFKKWRFLFSNQL